jgi:mycofactocin system glycosyltransferase
MSRLPDGFVVRLDRRVRVAAHGRELVGGSPTRVMYLTEVAQAMFVDRLLTVHDAQTATLADRLLEAGMAEPVLDARFDLDESDVTFVIPVRDRPEALDRLLASIDAATVCTASVIVVDDASVDPAATAAVAGRHGAKVVLLEANLGPAGARNAGLATVTTGFVAFADSDVVLRQETLRLLLRHFADPAVVLVAPRVLGLGTLSTHWISRYEDARSSLDLGPQPALVRPRTPVSWVSSTFLLARTSVLGDGFDQTLRVGEDVDLVWRLDAAGHRVRYEPAATVLHEHRAELGEWMSRKTFYGTGAHPLSQRHPHNIAPAVLAPWSAGVLVALLAQRRWSIPVAVGLTAIAAVRIARKLGARSEHPYRLGARLAGAGAASAAAQGVSLIVRHWWPLTIAAALFSRRARRAALVAALVDAALEYRRTGAGQNPLRFAIARRLDDLAYGAGVWLGALRGRSIAALLPDIRRTR